MVGLGRSSNVNGESLSIDDAVMDFLSKKGIVDQTEKLALARISSKLARSSEQVELSIKSLCAKNLVRKVYPNGKVGFELTPKGKAALEVMAKAESDRVTQLLQESILRERKTKLRLASINKLKFLADDWQNVQVPDISLIEEVLQESTKFLEETKEIASKQPSCEKDPERYDQDFSIYRSQIEKMAKQNVNLIRAVSSYAKITDYLMSISVDAERICKACAKYQSVHEVSAQVNELKISLSRLKSLRSLLEGFDEAQLSRFVELKGQLEDNSRLLDFLKKSTHEFGPSKKHVVSENVEQIPDPECPIRYSRRTGGSLLIEICSKCGIKRKSTPVNIG